MKIAIVAVGYNRPDSMHELLTSVEHANYENDSVDLIISIDKGEKQAEVVKVAENIVWPHGERIIRAFSERQGLRNHIIQCGDLTEYYDAVVVLEDDLIVSEHFYSYVKQTLLYYETDERIAGISLYKHQIHPGVNRPFEPVNNGYDVYLQQFAMSWGQCWSRKMWKAFKSWYLVNEEKDLSLGGILPLYISKWNKQSWLKYYMRYIVENDKYFVYPYNALSTDSSDVGEHCNIPNNDYQISILEGKMNYRFPAYEDAIKYDVFFERVGEKYFSELDGTIVLDLYGNRQNYCGADYAISTAARPYKVVRTIQLKYRPIEVNCKKPAEGMGIYVYDLHSNATAPKINNDILTRYDVRSIHWKSLLHLGVSGFIDAIKRKITGK